MILHPRFLHFPHPAPCSPFQSSSKPFHHQPLLYPLPSPFLHYLPFFLPIMLIISPGSLPVNVLHVPSSVLSTRSPPSPRAEGGCVLSASSPALCHSHGKDGRKDGARQWSQHPAKQGFNLIMFQSEWNGHEAPLSCYSQTNVHAPNQGMLRGGWGMKNILQFSQALFPPAQSFVCSIVWSILSKYMESKTTPKG